MSNIYIQEPPTSGKVLLKTSVGDIDIELWSKECPKTCRNFIQLCLEGYYNGTIFHRVVKGFIVQGGDPCNNGTGGESVYGEAFKDEFHSRLRYARRGLVGMANSGIDDNGSQFFFTMAPTPELQAKNTLFGKVTGDTVFNMLKLEEGLVDQNERPLYPQKILRTEILSNPFLDIVPREQPKAEKENKRKREKGVKNFGLLSFGEEAEEDEEESNIFVQKNCGKAKSLHDVVDDVKLSKSSIKTEETYESADSHDEDALPEERSSRTEITRLDLSDKANTMQVRHRIKEKLERNAKATKEIDDSESDPDVLLTDEHEKRVRSEKKKEEIRQEIQTLKREYQTERRMKDELLEKKSEADNKKGPKDLKSSAGDNVFIKNFIAEKEKYTDFKSNQPKKGAGREEFTLSLLSKFRSKLEVLREQKPSDVHEKGGLIADSVVEHDLQSDDWLAHTLKFEENAPIVAKDANKKDDGWYDVYDPRNPLNKRKRGEGVKSSDMLKKKRH